MIKGKLNYNEAKSIIKHSYQQINTVKSWFVFASSPGFPPYLPEDPSEYYSLTGEWKGWEDFLNIEDKPSIGILPYSSAAEIMKTLEIHNMEEYSSFYKIFNPVDLPENPHEFYLEFEAKTFFFTENF